MGTKQILIEAIAKNASDIFIVAGKEICFKIHGGLYSQSEERLKPSDTKVMIETVYALAERDMDKLMENGDDDFSFAIAGEGRFRVNAYKQRGSFAAIIRVVKFELPNPEALGIPEQVMAVSAYTKGLVLVTGQTGSGKSTTLSCLIKAMNQTRQGHIITLEDPIEFMHKHDQCIISQREIGVDTESYITGLRAALREVPDVILLGEMRDLETISTAMTAAETGQLVFSTLHTFGAANTIDRIIDVFPPSQQHQIRVQLGMVLKAVISQQLIPTDNGPVPVFEVMLVNQAIRNMIREGKIHQIDAMLANLSHEGMQTMDGSLLEAYKKGKLTEEQARMASSTPDLLDKKIQQHKV